MSYLDVHKQSGHCDLYTNQRSVAYELNSGHAMEEEKLKVASLVQVAEELASRTKVLNWMLKRLKPREFDVNKGAVGESLALLLQSSQANAQKAADLNGIDAILQVRPAALSSSCLNDKSQGC